MTIHPQELGAGGKALFMAGDGGATIYTVNSWGKAKKVDCQNMEAGLLIQLEALIAAEIDRRRETGDLAAMADRPADQIALMDKAQTSNRKAGGWSNQAALYQEVIHRIRQLERQLAAQRRPQAACRDEERKALRAAMEDRVNTGMGCRTGTGCCAPAREPARSVSSGWWAARCRTRARARSVGRCCSAARPYCRRSWCTSSPWASLNPTTGRGTSPP